MEGISWNMFILRMEYTISKAIQCCRIIFWGINIEEKVIDVGSMGIKATGIRPICMDSDGWSVFKVYCNEKRYKEESN
jgi:hypothetical protein